jgi:hypothetical protein
MNEMVEQQAIEDFLASLKFELVNQANFLNRRFWVEGFLCATLDLLGNGLNQYACL